MPEALVVRRETHIAAPPAAVFALLTDPEKILRWMGTEAQVEPQPGGLYLVNVTGARFARGSFRETRVMCIRFGPTLCCGYQQFGENPAASDRKLYKAALCGARLP